MNVTRHAVICVRLFVCAVLVSNVLVGGEGSADETTPAAAETEETELLAEAESESETESEQTAEPAQGLEEITVTARRREEDIQETPISITAFSTKGLEERAIRDLTELSSYTPNLRFTAAAANSGSAQVYIRGIGQSEGTINSEPRVGIYLDDVYQARPLGSVLAILDLERIEVLRGPQGTLYGKNAIGGAINIISNRPDDEFRVSGEVEFGNLDYFAGRLMLNVPVAVAGLGDKLFLRGSALFTRRDGYLWDTNLEEEFATSKLVTGRAAVRFLPIESLDLQVSYSQTKQPRKSRRGECELVAGQEDSKFMQAVQDPIGIGALGGADFIAECEASHEYTISTNLPNKDEIDTRKIYGHISWDTPEIPAIGSLTVESITAYQSLVQNYNFDWDSTALTLISSEIRDLGVNQISQELRVHGSAWDERVQWTLGGFYLREKSWGPPSHSEGVIVEFEFQEGRPLFPLEGIVEGYSHFNHQTAAAYLFGSLEPIDRLHLNAGFRFGWEQKDLLSYSETDLSGYISGTWFPLPVFDGKYNIFGAIEILAENGSEVTNSWTAPTGNFNITYDITDDAHVYAGYQRGFSSGGYNFISNDELGTPNAFEPETLDGVEVGIKTTWLDRRLVVNLNYFWNYYHDMQVRINEATQQGVDDQLFGLRTVVRNAGNAWLQGVELETSYMPVDDLILVGNLGLTFPNYQNFQLLNEELTREASSRDPVTGEMNIVPIYDDLSDNDFVNTPEINFSLLASYTWAISGDFELTPSADYGYQSKVYFDVRNTEELSEGGYGLLNFRLALDILRTDTTVMLWMKNSLDERYLTGGMGFGSYVSRYYGPPRTYGITITQRLGGS